MSNSPIRVVLATHNAHKVIELTRILGSQLEGFELIAYDGPEPIEDGDTFTANALIKARAAAAYTGLPSIADDSGICVDALGGAPGIHSARYAGTRSDSDNVDKLLSELGQSEDRSAQFECVAALVIPEGGPDAPAAGEWSESGTWPGSVLSERAGTGGFGYDPVFKPDGHLVSSAELHPDEKNAISHRARAFGRLITVVREQLGD